MDLLSNHFYHLYNRTNNREQLFRSAENYGYFIKKYRHHMEPFFETIGYCLMPTHYHFLVRIRSVVNALHRVEKDEENSRQYLCTQISKGMQTLQSSYTKALNKMYQRNGSLFQAHYKAKQIDNNRYLINLLAYIHQNPVRAGLTKRSEEWAFSSYSDYFDYRNGTLPNKEIIFSMIKKEEFRMLSSQRISIEYD